MKRVFSLILIVAIIMSSGIIVSASSAGSQVSEFGGSSRFINATDLAEKGENAFIIKSIALVEENVEIDEDMKAQLMVETNKDALATSKAITISIGEAEIIKDDNRLEPLEEIFDFGIIESENIQEGYTIEITDDGDMSPIGRAPAAGPDMSVVSLSADPTTTNSSGNFTVGSIAGIDFTIRNFGTSTASNVRLYLKINNVSQGYFSLGNFPAGGIMQDTLDIGGLGAGTHTIEFYIPTVSGETVTTNNTLSRAFTWVSASGASADLTSAMLSPTENDLLGCVEKTMEFRVYNIGTQVMPAGWPLVIEANGDIVFNIPNNNNVTQAIQPGSSDKYQVEMGTSKDAMGAFEIKVTPNPEWGASYKPESNYSNNASSRTYNIVPNYASYQNMFKNKGTVSVHIAPSVTALSGVSQSLITSWTTGSEGWNAHNPYFNFGAPSFTTTHSNQDVRVVASNIADPNTDGLTTLNTSGGWASVIIHNGTMNNSRTVKSCYIHEFGHIVGLDHPNDQYGRWYFPIESIMFTDGAPYEKYLITNTDKYVIQNTVFDN